jgi:pimeloyl-ACP methyl ester carboxylesterase
MDESPPVLNYISSGAGSPVILVHGIAASLNHWTGLLPSLTGAGYHVYAVDLPGHGDSPKPGDPAEYDFACQFTRFEQWISSLNLSQPPVLVGHSLGGLFSLSYAWRHPARVRGQILLNPFYTRRQLSPALLYFGKHLKVLSHAVRLAPTWLLQMLTGLDPAHSSIDRAARRQAVADYKRASPLVYRALFTVPDLTPLLPSVKPVTLVVWGQEDYTLKPTSFTDLVETLPNARGRSIPSCGHQPHLGKPQMLSPVVLEFLASLSVN